MIWVKRRNTIIVENFYINSIKICCLRSDSLIYYILSHTRITEKILFRLYFHLILLLDLLGIISRKKLRNSLCRTRQSNFYNYSSKCQFFGNFISTICQIRKNPSSYDTSSQLRVLRYKFGSSNINWQNT